MSDDAGRPAKIDLRKRERTALNNASVAMSLRKRKVFLRVLRQTGKVAFAARKAGYSDTSTVHRVKLVDEEFRKAWDEAVNAAQDRFEDEAIRRGVEGVDKPIMYKGEVVGYETEYSDQLLMFMMRAGRPEKYRESVSVSGTIQHNVGVAILPMTATKMEDWERAALEVQGTQALLTAPGEIIDQEGNVVRASTLVRR